jgi:hypothetical protein
MSLNKQRILLILLAIAVVFGMKNLIDQFPAMLFSMAQQTWKRQQPTHYQMTVDYNSLSTFRACQQQVVVKNEIVVRVLENTCESIGFPSNAMTISDIFALFRSAAIGQTCGPNGCVCDGVIQVDAVYDPIGYPRRIENKLVRNGFDVWKTPLCTMIGFERTQVVIRKFEALP